MTFVWMLLLVAALGAVSLLVGRLLVGSLKADRLRRLDPTGAAASLVLGTAILTLFAVWLSEMGLPSPAVVDVVPILIAVLLAACWRRGRLDTLRPRGPARGWAALLVPALAAAVFALLPVLRTNGYSIGNDTYTYSAYSEWLQLHGFGEVCPNDLESPVTTIPRLYQQLHYDLGISHLLGVVQAGSGSPSALLAYPPTAAWAMVLLVCGLVLVMRWVLRLSWVWTGGAALLLAVVPHAVYWGHHNGSLQQSHALPVLLLGVALLARSANPRWWRAGTVGLLAIPIAYLIVVYLPVLPVLGGAGLVVTWQGFVEARRHGLGRRGLAFASGIGLLVVVLAFRDLVGALERYVKFVTDAPGTHIRFTVLEFVQFAAGTRVLAPGWSNVEIDPWSAANRALTSVYLLLGVVGLGLAWRSARTRGLAAVSSILLLAVGYYALLARDPWTNEVGHTWSLFKLCQWAFPLLLLLEALGLERITRRLGRARTPVRVVTWALPLTLMSVHWVWSGQLGLTMRDILTASRPLADLPAIKGRIQELPEGTILVVGRPANRHRWLGAVTALLAYPRPIVGNWSASASMPEANQERYDSLLRDIGRRGVVPLIAGFVPFQPEGVEDLGGGFARVLPSGNPLVVHVINPLGLGHDEVSGRPRFEVDHRRTKIILHAPAEMTAKLIVTLLPRPAGEKARLLLSRTEGGYDHRSVRRAAEAPPAISVPIADETALELPVSLRPGLTTVILRLDQEAPPPRPVTVVGLRVVPATPAARDLSVESLRQSR